MNILLDGKLVCEVDTDELHGFLAYLRISCDSELSFTVKGTNKSQTKEYVWFSSSMKDLEKIIISNSSCDETTPPVAIKEYKPLTLVEADKLFKEWGEKIGRNRFDAEPREKGRHRKLLSLHVYKNAELVMMLGNDHCDEVGVSLEVMGKDAPKVTLYECLGDDEFRKSSVFMLSNDDALSIVVNRKR